MSEGTTQAPESMPWWVSSTIAGAILAAVMHLIGSRPSEDRGDTSTNQAGEGVPGQPSRPPKGGSRGRKWLTALLFILGLFCAGYCGWKAYVPDTPTTPGGMLALEFPGPRSGVLAALGLLDAAKQLGEDAVGRGKVRTALYWDYGFIACYTTTGCFAIFWVVRRRFKALPESEGTGPSWLVAQAAIVAPIVAGAFDIVENVALLSILDEEVCGKLCANAGLLGSITTLGALFKWTLAVFATAYLVYSLFFVVGQWVRRAPADSGSRPVHAKL